MIIIPQDEKERILHGLIKGKIIYKPEEKERKTEPHPMKLTKEGFADPGEIIKGRLSYGFYDKAKKSQ